MCDTDEAGAVTRLTRRAALGKIGRGALGLACVAGVAMFGLPDGVLAKKKHHNNHNGNDNVHGKKRRNEPRNG